VGGKWNSEIEKSIGGLGFPYSFTSTHAGIGLGL